MNVKTIQEKWAKMRYVAHLACEKILIILKLWIKMKGKLVENPARAYQYSTIRQVKAETLAEQEIEDY